MAEETIDNDAGGKEGGLGDDDDEYTIQAGAVDNELPH